MGERKKGKTFRVRGSKRKKIEGQRIKELKKKEKD